MKFQAQCDELESQLVEMECKCAKTELNLGFKGAKLAEM
jgi:hypothetical protein